MEAVNKHRAQNVCLACRKRKKACDKILPACTWCRDRGHVCRYHLSTTRSARNRTYNPGKNFVPLSSFSGHISDESRTFSQNASVPEAQNNKGILTPLRSNPSELKLATEAARYCSNLGAITNSRVTSCFFETIHSWLPVLSPESFHRAAIFYKHERTPPTDFMVLRLAMLLVTFPIIEPASQSSTIDEARLYTTTKALFAQAQTSMPTSLWLAQAGILIALREYASMRLEASYVSVVHCAALSRLLRIDQSSAEHDTGDAQSRNELHQTGGVHMLRYGVAVLERLILCELQREDLKPLTDIPDFELSPLNHSQTMERNFVEDIRVHVIDSSSLAPRSNADTDESRKRQLICLADDILSVTRTSNCDINKKYKNLIHLEQQTRSLFAAVIQDKYEVERSICVSIATCVRLLFLIYSSIIETFNSSNEISEGTEIKMARSGLDMLSRLVLDAMYSRTVKQAPFMPICCIYNLLETIRHLTSSSTITVDAKIIQDVENLSYERDKYLKSWMLLE